MAKHCFLHDEVLLLALQEATNGKQGETGVKTNSIFIHEKGEQTHAPEECILFGRLTEKVQNWLPQTAVRDRNRGKKTKNISFAGNN